MRHLLNEMEVTPWCKQFFTKAFFAVMFGYHRDESYVYGRVSILSVSNDSNRGGGGGSNLPYILLNEIQTMFSQLAKQSSRQ